MQSNYTAGIWNVGKAPAPSVITKNNFVHKSLSNWSLNYAVGCGHGCRYCYVPSTSVNKLAPKLAALGITDPDSQWGDYTFLRLWDDDAFLTSLRTAENTPLDQLKPDGNRAVMLCTTTDAYQVIRDPKLQEHLRFMVRRSLELIRDHSTINVRILTRSPLVREDFDLLQSLGNRVMLGMSIPTLNNSLARVYEPGAPAPTQRLKTLNEAANLGLPTFAAIAPVFPESDDADLRDTIEAVADAKVMTIFAEPVNIRAENVARIKEHAADLGVSLSTDVFDDSASWQRYAISTLRRVEAVAHDLKVADRLHLWPDKSLGTKVAISHMPEDAREEHSAWLQRCWSRISEWPAS